MNIALFSAKMENDFLCMVLIIWLVVQIICLLNVARNWLKMILPATDGKTFSHVYFNIMLLFFLFFNSESYYFRTIIRAQGAKVSIPDSCFKNSLKTFKTDDVKKSQELHLSIPTFNMYDKTSLSKSHDF